MKNIKIIGTLTLSLLIVVGTMVWHLSQLQSSLIESTATKTAELYSVALTQFRTLYTSEVVVKAKRQGLDVTHDYVGRDNAIPLPATLSIKLGEEIGKNAYGINVQLLSPYPFPWRKEENQAQYGDFEKEAWNYLLMHKDQAYLRFETVDAKTVLHYATADIMRPQCVACHNSHPDSPKNDWKVSDLRGLLVISLSLDDIVSETESNLRTTSLAYIVIGLGLVIIIGVVIIKLNRQSKQLETQVADRTASLKMEVTERLKAIDAMTAAEEQNRLLLNTVGEGIYGIDLEGKANFANPAACKMLGYETEELLYQPVHALIHHSYPDGSFYPFEKCFIYTTLTDGEVYRADDEVLWRKDGSCFPVEYISTPLLKDGQLKGAVVTFKDITERKKMERMKDEFISTVSHELRTPLTSLKGSLDLVISGVMGDVAEEPMDLLKLAYKNSERLELLIFDLLDINKMQASKTAFKMSKLDVFSLINNAIDANQGYAGKYNVQLIWKPSEDEQIYISGDENRLIQVLSNLLSNAIKYSPEKAQVVVTVNCDNEHVRVSIADSGSGIPVQFQDKVFERFSQADSSNTRQVGGTGLGLAIAKEIIEGHNGRIDFDSTVGQGTTFYFELPIKKIKRT